MMKQVEIEETLLKHSQIANEQSKVAERHTDFLLTLTTSYFELLEKVGQQKMVILAQGKLLEQCMERIMQLEGRSILANFNQRIEQLEVDKGSYYAINKEQLPRMMENLVRRVDELESWLYTHDSNYFQKEENERAIEHDTVVFKQVDDLMQAPCGNSSFEKYEMHHPGPSHVENDPFDRNVPGFDGGIDSSLEREDIL